MRDELQLPPTSRLAIYMPNHPLAVIWTEAAKRLGLAYVAVAGGTVAAVLAERIDDTGASLVVSSTELQSTVNAALEQSAASPRVVLTRPAAEASSSSSEGSSSSSSQSYYSAELLIERAREQLRQSNSLASSSSSSSSGSGSSSGSERPAVCCGLVEADTAEGRRRVAPLFVLYTSARQAGQRE